MRSATAGSDDRRAEYVLVEVFQSGEVLTSLLLPGLTIPLADLVAD
jgi:hypothetical protein